MFISLYASIYSIYQGSTGEAGSVADEREREREREKGVLQESDLIQLWERIKLSLEEHFLQNCYNCCWSLTSTRQAGTEGKMDAKRR